MSGPKADSFRVVAKSELRQRQELVREAELAQLAQAHAGLVAQAEEADQLYGITVTVRPLSGGDVAAGRSQLREDAERLGDAIASTRMAAIRSLAASSRGQRDVSRSVSEQDWRADIRDEITRLSGRLEPGATRDDGDSVLAAARAATQAESRQHAKFAVDVLRERLQQANERTRHRRTAEGVLGSLRTELSGLQHELVTRALASIDAAERSSTVTDALKEEVAAARLAATFELDRRFAVGVLRDCLSELGYDVGPEFDTALVDPGPAKPRRADARSGAHPGYAVRVWANPNEPGFAFRIVRGHSNRLDRREVDAAAETTWCADHDELLERARARGLELKLVRGTPAGDQDVAEVDDLAVDTRHHEEPIRRARSFEL